MSESSSPCRPTSDRSPAEIVAVVTDLVADKYGQRPADILGRRRNSLYVWSRQVTVTLASEALGQSNAVMGALFGLDPTTVLHSMRKVVAREQDTPKVAADLADLRKALRARVPELPDITARAVEAHRHRLQLTVNAEEIAPTERELALLLRSLRHGLIAALRTDPGAVIAGLRRAVDEINDRRGRQ